MLAGGWSLLCQAGLPAMLECQARGVSVDVAGGYGSGLLAGGETYAYQVSHPFKPMPIMFDRRFFPNGAGWSG